VGKIQRMKLQTRNGLAVLPVRKYKTQELPSPLGQNLAKLASANFARFFPAAQATPG